MLENLESLIRFAMPGGYAIMIGLFEESLFGWAWHARVDELISASPADALSTIGGAVIVSFILTAIDRTVEHLRHDSSNHLGAGAVQALVDVPGVGTALQRVCGPMLHDLGEIPADVSRRRRAEIDDERIDVIRSLTKLACKTGDQEIASSYNNQVGWYHVYGACRTAVVVIVIATAVEVAVKHHDAFAAQLERSLLVSLGSLALGGLAWAAFGLLRRRARESMTRQLKIDLRAWALQHPELWSQLGAASAPELKGERRQVPLGTIDVWRR